MQQTEFRAFRVNQEDDAFSAQVEHLTTDDLPAGDLLIKVHYSSVNFKDAMTAVPDSKIAQKHPLTPGIDLAGEVVESSHAGYVKGDQVIATSYEIGVSHDGGYSEYARVPAEWTVPLPSGITLEESMVFGTAGFTAALSIDLLEKQGITPEDAPILVTGATGGVGSMAVAMLSHLGYEVVASTGKEAEGYLKELGASDVISRKSVYDGNLKPIGKQKWAAAVDPVGGEPLASILSHLKYGGAAAVSGLTAGTQVPTAVFPFILRGVSLLGADSVNCPMERRQHIWNRLASDMKPENKLDTMKDMITLEDLPNALSTISEGQARGRMVVKL
ncbi:acryloyl-CoA reductase [Thalassobacillus sp. CUG 92003]|uniref:acrylyl-CoA reductase family protein n=1 Tax=Thalassobacillus sp. CUG 92003 TaxID=2736641 RepID=UPI0015E69EB7